MNDAAEAWHVSETLAGLIVLAAAAVSAALIAILRPLLSRYALARPNARSSHRAPTPQGGGLAVVACSVGAALVWMLAVPQLGSDDRLQLAAVACATALLAILGAVDDLRGLGAGVKLALQAIAVAAVIAALPSDIRVLPSVPIWWERAPLVVGGVYFVNIVNFMDGIDWITVAEVVPVTLGLVLIGALGELPAYAVVVALALLGSTLGFALFNRPPARLFLGDVGSLPIGLLLGWLLLLLAAKSHVAAALLLPLYYLADATITLLRRLRAGQRIWAAHRTHFYQRATDRGLSVIQVDARVFAVNLALLALALTTVAAARRWVDLAALLLGGGLVAALLANFARGKR
jgi:UDP-N-acetylmuramyl pentapeptide phosphotransferase/UDP-N-acetylglucosamine-1-phosphate transferase